MSEVLLSRRKALFAGVAALAAPVIPGVALAQPRIGRSMPREFNLRIEHTTANITGRVRPAIAINGQIPAPLLRFREGEEVIINVANRLREDTSIHWHGLILPSGQDGVPGISDGFQGIAAGQTHQYRFPLVQAGTYWYHSHSSTQEQAGMYGPIVIDPVRPDPVPVQQDHIIVLSDWTDENPHRIIQNLKRDPGYYNYNRRTAVSLFRELQAAPNGEARAAVVRDRMMWADMRMDPTDIEDVTGYTFLVNGRTPQQNFTALYQPGQSVRLRFINSGAMSHFDVRIPGLQMTVIQAHGNNVVPVTVDEFRIAPSETFDVVVRPAGDRQYQVLAESMGRQGFASFSLATREGLSMMPLPPHRERPLLTMADMGGPYGPTGLDRGTLRPEVDRPASIAPMDMGSMDHGAMGHGGAGGSMAGMNHGNMPGMNQGASGGGAMAGMNHAAMGHAMPGAAAGGMAMAQARPQPGGTMDHSNMPGMDHSTMPGMNHGPGANQPTGGAPARGGQQPRQPAQPPRGGQPAAPGSQRGSAPTSQNHAAMGHGASPGRGQVGQVDMSAANAGAGHGAMAGMGERDPWASNTGAPTGAKVLSYRDLRALNNHYPVREPDRMIEVRLTGNMERYFWSINGNRFSEAQPIVLWLGERVRMRFINETMMSHPMHLHGLWMQPQVGNGQQNPLLHVVSIKPGSTAEVDVEADAEGGWAFHCHMLFHMETGMMRKVEVRRRPQLVSAR